MIKLQSNRGVLFFINSMMPMVVFAIIIVSAILGIIALPWGLWCLTMPMIFPTASTTWTSPTFWQFAALIFLAKLLYGFLPTSKK